MNPHRLGSLLTGILLALALAGCATNPGAATGGTAVPATPADTSRTSLDWAGTYYGVLPCADCAGIATTVTLDPDDTFRSRLHYLGKGGAAFDTHGRFTWDAAGSSITLDGNDPARYLVGENRLIRLAQDGSRITGPLASHYELAKGPVAFTGTRWELLAAGDHTAPANAAASFLVFDAEHRVHGSDGCNVVTGSYAADSSTGQLELHQLATTRRFCVHAMQVADAFADALGATRAYAIDGGELTLKAADGATVARFLAVPSADDARR